MRAKVKEVPVETEPLNNRRSIENTQNVSFDYQKKDTYSLIDRHIQKGLH